MNLKTWLTSVLMGTLLFSAVTCKAAIDKIIVFGDSLSDNGNVYNMLARAKKIMPLVPLIPKNPPYSEGRFTNGLVWIEHLAKSMNVPLVNYAYGGAWAEGFYDSYQVLPPSLSIQVDMYSVAPSTVIDYKMKHHLYVIWAGSNDYLQGRKDPEYATTNTVESIAIQVDWLLRMGAQQFMILNLVDLSRVPTSIEKGPDFVRSMQQIVHKHNDKLAQRIEKIKLAHPTANIIYMDVAKEFDDLVSNPAKFNLKNIAEPCYTGGYLLGANQFAMDPEIEAAKQAKFEIANNSVLMDAYINSVAASKGHQSCTNPDDFLFWDKTHPTRLGHQLIALAAFNKLAETGTLNNQ